jgi:hypothetical protein
MEMQDAYNETQRHLEAAYALLPDTLNPSRPGERREWVDAWYRMQEWRSLFNFLTWSGRVNEFSTELRYHLTEAEKNFELYDRLGMRAALQQLTSFEKQVIGECLRAASYGPFFPDYVFTALFSVERKEAIRVAETWPNVDETDIRAGRIINDVINNLFGYPHRKHDQWARYISVPQQQVAAVYHRFRELTGRRSNRDEEAAVYFHNLD